MIRWKQFTLYAAWHDFGQVMRQEWPTSLGGAIEWYDFCLYAYFALTFSHLFFPATHKELSLMLVFSTYALGILVRPFGGWVFGHFADNKGHLKGLGLAINSIAIPTFCIGLLPNYQQAGVWAPVALIGLRCLQGLCAGGQYVGAMTVLTERSPVGKGALSCSIAHVTSLAGYLLAVVVCFSVVHLLSKEVFLQWGWRIPFLLSIVFLVVNVCWRLYDDSLQERPTDLVAWQQNNNTAPQKITRWPFLLLWRNYRWQLFVSTTLAAVMGALYSSVFVFMFSFIQKFSAIGLQQALLINGVALVLSCLLVPWFAVLADNFGRVVLLRQGFILTLVVAMPAVFFIVSGNIFMVLLGVSLLVAAVTMIIAPAAVTYCELFPEAIRYSGTAISYNLGVALLGGTTPLLIQTGIIWRGSAYFFGFYLLFMALFGLLTTSLLRYAKIYNSSNNVKESIDYALTN